MSRRRKYVYNKRIFDGLHSTAKISPPVAMIAKNQSYYKQGMTAWVIEWSAIVIWSKDRRMIAIAKFNDRNRKNAIFLAIFEAIKTVINLQINTIRFVLNDVLSFQYFLGLLELLIIDILL